jgi:hypothetical protein
MAHLRKQRACQRERKWSDFQIGLPGPQRQVSGGFPVSEFGIPDFLIDDVVITEVLPANDYH